MALIRSILEHDITSALMCTNKKKNKIIKMLSKYIPGSIYFIILLHNEQMDKEGVNPGSGSVNVY